MSDTTADLPPAAPPGPRAAPTLIGSVRRAMRLLEAAAQREGGATAKQLARQVGLPIATAYHLLRTLTHDGYLRRVDGAYVVGEAAARFLGPLDRQAARTEITGWLDRLRDELGAAAYFATYEGGEVRVVARADSAAHPAVEEHADFRRTAHAHAIGQCLLAQLDDDARRDHLARHPAEPLTPSTVTDHGTLLRLLARKARVRPVTERREYAADTVCAAVPITVGAVPSTLALSLPLARAGELDALADALKRRTEATLTGLAFSVWA